MSNIRIRWLGHYHILSLLFVLFLIGDTTAAVIEHSGTISTHTTWSSADVHLITNNVTVESGVILTIEQGTVVKFNSNRRINIAGALDARGTDSDKIYFTSYRDDSLGGDTNGDGSSAGQAGDWQRIQFDSTVTSTLTFFENVIIRFGGSGNFGSIYIGQTDIAIATVDVRHSSSHGIYVQQASPSITESIIEENGLDGIYLNLTGSALIQGNTIGANNNGVYVNGSPTPTLDNNQIVDNAGWGIFYQSSPGAPVLTNNVVTGNRRSGIIPATSVPNAGDNNILSPNKLNGVWIRGNTRTTDLELPILFPGEPHEVNTYQIYGTFTISNSATLTVAPGVVLKFVSGAQLDINGVLLADGTAEQPIVFTSFRDDTYGGDMNLDGYSIVPMNGDWDRLYFSFIQR